MREGSCKLSSRSPCTLTLSLFLSLSLPGTLSLMLFPYLFYFPFLCFSDHRSSRMPFVTSLEHCRHETWPQTAYPSLHMVNRYPNDPRLPRIYLIATNYAHWSPRNSFSGKLPSLYSLIYCLAEANKKTIPNEVRIMCVICMEPWMQIQNFF